MRRVLALGLFVLLSGCASEYSDVPEARGEWMPANPSSLTVSGPVQPVERAYWTNSGVTQ